MEKRVKTDNNYVPAKKMATNHCYTLAVNDFGDLYSWGSNKESRLGHKQEGKSDKGDILDNPRKYDYFTNNYLKVIEVSCGTSHIAVIVANKSEAMEELGKVYTWGLPLYGRLGYLDEDDDQNQNFDNDMMVYKTLPKMVNLPDKAVRIACGTDFTACITERGHLYTWGTNKSGYLGVENITYDGEQAVVTTPTLVKTLVNKVVLQVVCGSKHMMCLTSERTVFSWGCGDNGILGHGNTYGLNKPELIKELKNDDIIFIAAGDFSSAAINNRGHLYTWGKGKYGILGLGSEENVTLPRRVTDGNVDQEKVFFVALGFYHTLCCTSKSIIYIYLIVDGKTFSWGYSEKGRLGCIDKSECDQKKRISTPREVYVLRGNAISQVFAGHYHSFAISVNGGKIWGWGENTDSVLGNVEDEVDDPFNKKKSRKIIFYKPLELKVNKNLVRISGGISDLYAAYFYFAVKVSQTINVTTKGKVKKIACGGSHSLALTTQKDVFSWGYGEEGQLGLKELKCATSPMRIEFGADRKIGKIYSGYSHSMAITTTSEIFVWGDGKLGQLGRSVPSSNEPIAIDDLSGREVVKGACGYDNCAAITNDGKLYMWGGNNSFKLGIPNGHNEFESAPRHVEALNAVKKISCGFAHSAAINNNGELYTWGHGFFGQLGHGDIITKKEPLKVDHNDLKYKKVKCGSYQTVTIDKKSHVYIWGRGGINLNQDPSKHKKLPEVVEDFKSVNIKSIQAGNGNTLLLTEEYDVYAWGDNTDGKSGGDNKIVAKSAKEIKFKNENKKKAPIFKIFAGFSHCFAIAESGDIYGWGSSKCFRLTQEYGDHQEMLPKMINLFSGKSSSAGNNTNNVSTTNNNDADKIKSKKNDIDERFILARLEDKNPVTNFKELLILIENDDLKFSDPRLNMRDDELNDQIREGLNKIAANSDDISTDKYIHIDKLLNLRFRNMKVPIKPELDKSIPVDISNNISEIEKIYTMFYLHPCFFKDYFEDEITPSNFSDFLQGIKPLFTELQSYSKKSESLDNVIFLTFFKMLIEYDLKIYKRDIDKLYSKQNSFSELLIEFYFYNNFGRSILIDIFSKSMKDLYSICLNYAIKSSFKKKSKDSKDDTEIISTFKALKSLFINSKSLKDEKDVIRKENIEEVISITKTFINDFESNISKLPIYVSFCLTKIKKKMYKLLITAKDKATIKSDKNKIKSGIMKLFYKNILSRLLKKLIAENKEFLKSQLKMNETDVTAQRIFEYYVLIIAEFIDKISQNKTFDLTEDREDSNLVYLLNMNIKEFHTRINEIFKTKLIKSKYDLKQESLSSIIYSNTSPHIKKIKVQLKDLIGFLKVLNKAKTKSRQVIGLLDLNNYKVFNLFEPELFSIKSNIKYDQTLKINLYIDIRFLLNPFKYSDRFATEVRFSQIKKDAVVIRCSLCNLMVPRCFVLSNDKRDPFLTRSFVAKIKFHFLQYVSEVIRDKAFPIEMNIASLKDLLEAVREVEEKKQKETNDSARIVRSALEDVLNRIDASDDNQFRVILNDIFDHLKLQHKHYSFITKITKVINDIDDASSCYVTIVNSINRDFDANIKGINIMEPSLDFLDDNNDNIISKKADLKGTKILLKSYDKYDSSKFRYKMVEQAVTTLKLNNILVEINLDNEREKDLVIQIISNTTKKIFDLIILAKKNKEVLRSFPFTYDDFMYASINSNIYSILSFPNFGKFNTTNFLNLINKQINDIE